MSIAFSGGNIQFTSFAGTTTTQLIGSIQTALTNAGWSIVSGTGTTNLVMKTPLTPQGLQASFKFHDNGLTVASQATVQISIQIGGTTGVDSTNSPWIRIHPSINFTIIAGPYYFWILLPSSFSDYGYFAMGGVPWIPAFQSSITQLGYLVTQNFPAGSTSTSPVTFRNSNTCCGRGVLPSSQLIFNANYISTDSGVPLTVDSNCSYLKPWIPPSKADYGGTNNVVTTPSLTTRFQDNSFCTADTWIGWATAHAASPNNGDPTLIHGMLWDSVFIFDNSQLGDTTTTFNGHSWYAISNQTFPILWVATS